MIDEDRIRTNLEELAEFTDTPGSGVTRFSYTGADERARHYLFGEVEELGLSPRVDGVGNIRVRKEGRESGAPAVLTGSHLDTVRNGGRLDGSLGVVGALETLRTLCRHDIASRHPVEMIVFAEEEGSNFQTTMMGSKFLTGQLGPGDLDVLTDRNGLTLRARLLSFGLTPSPDGPEPLLPEEVKAMVELHIEQSTFLEAEGIPLGIVDRIAGMRSYRVVVEGVGNHAGATPMNRRRDALATAAEMIIGVRRSALGNGGAGTVATVGRIDCHPNVANVIPERVEFTIDLRDVDDTILDRVGSALESDLAGIASAAGIGFRIEAAGSSAPGRMAPGVIEIIAAAAQETGYRYKLMNSGAVHDASQLSGMIDAGMILVPSIGGRSHVPEENTSWDDIYRGCDLLYRSVRALAE